MMRHAVVDRKWVMILVSLLLVFSLFIPLMSTQQVKAKAGDYKKIVGYYTSWSAYERQYFPADIDASKVTHINYAFADICWNGERGNPDTWAGTSPCQGPGEEVIDVPNGTIVLGDPWIDTDSQYGGYEEGQPFAGNLYELVKLKEKHPHLKTLISVGGWSWSNRFSDVAMTAETRETFAQSAVDFIRTYQMDGVDIDWEYPVSGGMPGNSRSPLDKQNHTLLLQAVRDALDKAGEEDGKQYLLTIASSASPTYLENNEMEKIAEILDFINIMTYDFNGGWQAISGHNAPLYFDEAAKEAGVPSAEVFHVAAAVQGHLNHGVPPEKLVMGVPFYGRAWGGCAYEEIVENPSPNTIEQPEVTSTESSEETETDERENINEDEGTVDEEQQEETESMKEEETEVENEEIIETDEIEEVEAESKETERLRETEEEIVEDMEETAEEEQEIERTPIYGQYANCTGPAPPGTWEPGVYDFQDLESNYINQNGYTRYWNDVAKVPFLFNEETGTFISYDDAESMAHKVVHIQDLQLGGAMFWEFYGDKNGTLLNVLFEGLNFGQTPPAPVTPTPPTEEDEDEDDSEKEPTVPTLPVEDGEEKDEGTVPPVKEKKEKEKKEEKEVGKKLPKTATNFYTYLLVGSMLVILGSIIYIYRRKVIKE
ncbi:glycoside hydrolase family 18 protein [Alkalihalobacterium bogoriense]|uniref:glycoside hydrolase family 18 protein n=1 Tax=Alkalihalobacterium bogoriense TaxID=246272 RepID=UPI000686F6FF|nr:glycosyl hydrolase family 18 protein [Alkalihalobacterium bogoriense]